MPVVEELITKYTAIENHTQVLRGVAQAQSQLTRSTIDVTKAREVAERVVLKEHKALEQSAKLQMQVVRLGKEEANERAAVARAVTAETRAREAQARALDKEERATRQLSAARKFANGFGSTRLNFGMASPLISSFTRGGVAGGLGALTATGLGGVMGGISSMGNAAMGGLSNLLSGGGNMLMGLGGKAEQAAMDQQSRIARLTALVGSQKQAMAVLQMAERVAGPSSLTTKQLADAATLLEAYGANAMRLLPIIGKLGTAMGAGSEQVQEYARAIGALAQGDMIDKEVLSAMGLSKADFAGKGVEFDNQGKLKSSAEKSLTALESIVNDKFGRIFEQMANTPEAKRASLEDAGDKALRIIGDGMLKSQGGLTEALTRSINAAVDSGVLAEVTNKISKAMVGAIGGDKTDPILRLMATGLSVINNLPDAAGKVFKYLGNLFGTIFDNIATAGKFAYDTIAAIWRVIGGPGAAQSLLGTTPGQGDVRAYDGTQAKKEKRSGIVQGGLFGTGDLQYLWDLMQKVVGYTPGAWIAKNLIPKLPGIIGSQFGMGQGALVPGLPALPQFKGLPSFDGSGVDFGKDTERFYQMLLGSSKGGAVGIPDTTGEGFLRRLTDPMDAIEEATKKTAKNTEPSLNEAIFGGGARARRGISYADVMGGSAGRGGGLTIRTDKAATTLQQALLEVFQQNLPEIADYMSRRQGMAY